MPELPEVETIAEDLRRSGIIGLEIIKADVFFPNTIAYPELKTFVSSLKGKKVVSIDRRGKFLILILNDRRYLFIHLRMSGQIRIFSKAEPVSKHEHVIIYFKSDVQLRFHDTRKFGRWYLVEDPSEITKKLGPEPLGTNFVFSEFKKTLLTKRRQIKPLLLDQSVVAGLGNIYVDEALWESKIHPETLSCYLNDKEIDALFSAIKFVLNRGIASKGTSLGTGKSNYARLEGYRGEHQTVLNVFRRTGLPCPRCATTICRIIVAQRSTHICPSCQKVFKI